MLLEIERRPGRRRRTGGTSLVCSIQHARPRTLIPSAYDLAGRRATSDCRLIPAEMEIQAHADDVVAEAMAGDDVGRPAGSLRSSDEVRRDVRGEGSHSEIEIFKLERHAFVEGVFNASACRPSGELGGDVRLLSRHADNEV